MQMEANGKKEFPIPFAKYKELEVLVDGIAVPHTVENGHVTLSVIPPAGAKIEINRDTKLDTQGAPEEILSRLVMAMEDMRDRQTRLFKQANVDKIVPAQEPQESVLDIVDRRVAQICAWLSRVEGRINDIEAKVEEASSIDLEPLYRSSYLLQERTKFLDEKDWDNAVKRVADMEDKIRGIGKRLDDAEGARQLQQQVGEDRLVKVDSEFKYFHDRLKSIGTAIRVSQEASDERLSKLEEDMLRTNKKLEQWKAEATEEDDAMFRKLDILRRSVINGIQAIQRTYREGEE